jgi:flagellar hook protein FlgE
MSIYGAFSTARSGLTAHSAALGVIGNNIANVSTIGFKGSRAEFADLLSAEQGGQIGKIGLGVRIGAVRTLFGQGTIETTGRALDLAMEGDGFFVLANQDGDVYTRAGNFQVQADGTVTNLLGYALQGMALGGTGDSARTSCCRTGSRRIRRPPRRSRSAATSTRASRRPARSRRRSRSSTDSARPSRCR